MASFFYIICPDPEMKDYLYIFSPIHPIQNHNIFHLASASFVTISLSHNKKTPYNHR